MIRHLNVALDVDVPDENVGPLTIAEDLLTHLVPAVTDRWRIVNAEWIEDDSDFSEYVSAKMNGELD